MSAPAAQWEYKVLSIRPGGKKAGLLSIFLATGGHADEGGLQASLNALGADGWELVSTTLNTVAGAGSGFTGAETMVFVFKRPTSTASARESVRVTVDAACASCGKARDPEDMFCTKCGEHYPASSP